MAPDEGLHDAALFWYFYAAFLNKSLDDTLDSAKTFLFKSQQVLKDVLEAIHKHDDADLLAVFTKDKPLAHAFDNLSQKPRTTSRTQPSPPEQQTSASVRTTVAQGMLQSKLHTNS